MSEAALKKQLAECKAKLAEKKAKRASRKPTAQNIAFKAFYAKNKDKIPFKGMMKAFWAQYKK
jgi:hypothetical protein